MDDEKKLPIQPDVISVIEISGDDGLVTSLKVWMNNPHGQDAAEECFTAICKETTDLTDKQILQAIDDGYAQQPGGGTVCLVSSNNNF